MTLMIAGQTLFIQLIVDLNELSGGSVKPLYSVCPMEEEMDFSPRQVMYMAQFGLFGQLADK